MAGVKGRSGGARPGAGRKAKEPAFGAKDPLVFLEQVWTGQLDATVAQVRAATAALPFKHQRLGEGGKKEQKLAEAGKVASRFGAAAPPRLVAAGGKKV